MEIKKIIIYIIIFFAVTIITVTALKYFVFYKATLNVSTNLESKISFNFDDTIYEAPIILKNIKPGEHIIFTHVAGYKDYKKTINLKKFENTSLKIELEELNTEEAILDVEESWGKDFIEDKKVAAEERKKLEEKNPLIKFLPYFTATFWFDYSVDRENVSYFLRTNNPDQDLNNVKVWINSKGIDSSKINIKIEKK